MSMSEGFLMELVLGEVMKLVLGGVPNGSSF